MDDRVGTRGSEALPDDSGPTPFGGTEVGFTEAELTELALAADPDAPMGDDAIPLSVYLGQAAGLLPQVHAVPDGTQRNALASSGGPGHRGCLRGHRGIRPLQHLWSGRSGLSDSGAGPPARWLRDQ